MADEGNQNSSTSKQSSIGNTVSGPVNMFSDAKRTEQVAENSSMTSLDMKSEQPSSLGFGKYSAVGKWGIVALVAVIAIGAAANYLMK